MVIRAPCQRKSRAQRPRRRPNRRRAKHLEFDDSPRDSYLYALRGWLCGLCRCPRLRYSS